MMDKQGASQNFESEMEISPKSCREILISFSQENLEALKCSFKSESLMEEMGLNREEFANAVLEICDGKFQSAEEIEKLYHEINHLSKPRIKWDDFLNFIIATLESKSGIDIFLELENIFTVPHTKRETISKIVPIETDKYFCYAVVSAHGRVGLYDGLMDFLLTYQVIMTREDELRTEEERRRRNRWITDALFASDLLVFIIASSTRSIVIYEASGLKHIPVWLILDLPNIIQCLGYKPVTEKLNYPVLFLGDERGSVFSMKFLKGVNMLRKKHSEKLSIFYWEELSFEESYIKITDHLKCKGGIRRIELSFDNEMLAVCCEDPNASVVLKSLVKIYSATFKIKEGARIMAFSKSLRILITGSANGSIKIWNTIMTSRPIAILKEHSTSSIIDLVIFEEPEVFLSLSLDFVLRLWDIKERNCVHVIKINYPCLNTLGKSVEYGNRCIYPGHPPKKVMAENIEDKKNGDLLFYTKNDIWKRPYVIVTCCNYMAKIRIQHTSKPRSEIEWPIMQPPPLQNSVLIPKAWKMHSDHQHNQDVKQYERTEVSLEHVRFILDKKDLPGFQKNGNINYKLATLEATKLQMQSHVAEVAPYLALDLHEIEKLKLSKNLPAPSSRKNKFYSELCATLLAEADVKDVVFSEPSTSRSKSSLIESI